MPPYDRTVTLAADIIMFRRSRRDLLPAEIFSETAWDLLLELFVADTEGRPMTGTLFCRRSGESPLVVFRWVKYLVGSTLVIGDGDGNLDDRLTLSPTGRTAMENLFSRVIARDTELARQSIR